MNNSLSIIKDRNLLEQLIYEFKYSLNALSEEDLNQLMKELLKISMKHTYRSKKKAVKNTASFLYKTSKRYAKNGIKKSMEDDGKKMVAFGKDLPQKGYQFYKYFRSLDGEDKVELIVSIFLFGLVFFAAGGGTDMEGGIPDMDIAMGGIGFHRSIFTHSIVSGLGMEITARFIILIIERFYQYLPAVHSKFWDKLYRIIEGSKETTIAAMWLGIGTHLLKDTGLIFGNAKPYVELTNGMSMSSHQGIFAANGTLSSIFGSGTLK